MVSESGEVRCGRPFRLPAAAALRLVACFPESAPAGRQSVEGNVEITGGEPMRGVAAGAADVFLVGEGRVVTMPVVQDAIGIRWVVAAGEARKLPAVASLLSCEPAGGRLAPGVYDLYARVVVTADDGEPQTFFGGPWPLRVR